VETREVSRAPGREVWKSWKGKLLSSASQVKMRSIQKYWAPTFEDRSAHSGFSGSAGGWTGLGPTWQKPQVMPTR
jgi:hypothetical protein